MPSTPVQTFTFNMLRPARSTPLNFEDAVLFVPSAGSIPAGTILGQVTASGLWTNCIKTNTDGTQTARAIAKYDMQIDSNGKVTYSSTTGQVGMERGQVYDTAPVYFGGVFNTADVKVASPGTNSDKTAMVSDLGGVLISGSITSGLLKF